LALKRLGPVTDKQREAIEHFSRSLMNKFLHEPSVRLKAAAANGRGLGIVDAAKYLFALGEHQTAASSANGSTLVESPASETNGSQSNA
jgi:hypothetical protein